MEVPIFLGRRRSLSDLPLSYAPPMLLKAFQLVGGDGFAQLTGDDVEIPHARATVLAAAVSACGLRPR